MKDLTQKVAVVTGAASGIGQMLAVVLAKEGCRLAITDVDETGLKKTRNMLPPGTKVATEVFDVSNREAMYSFAQKTINDFGAVDIVINNAGVACRDLLEDVTFDDFEWVMNVNFWGVVYGTKAFLAHLKTRTEACIVNISSVNGFVPFPTNGPYNCSKYAVFGLNETLHQELAGTDVNVLSVHPGGIQTNIVRNSRPGTGKDGVSHESVAASFDRVASTTPEAAAEAIVGAIKSKKEMLLIGADAHALYYLKRLMPNTFNQIVGGLSRRLLSRD